MTSHGWAVVLDGEIDLRTVYGTRRGAMVNWLSSNGWIITRNMPDDAIEKAWLVATVIEAKAVHVTPRVVEVAVAEKPSAVG
jgi:N-acyl-L-homoserine lactone synthetase